MQSGYIPWIGFFELMQRADIFLIFDTVKFDKNSWRNRNRIKTAHGPLWLTVPVHSKGSPRLCEILIDNSTDWSKKHLKSIEVNYSKSPYFEEYFEGIKDILGRRHKYLNDLNLEIIKLIASSFNINKQLFQVSELENSDDLDQPDKVDRLIRICKQFGGDIFYEPSGGKNYLEPELKKFDSAGIRIIFQDIMPQPYPQLYGEFIPNLSALDLLFNVGEAGKEIIIKSGANIIIK